MKKICSVLISMLLIISLVGCSKPLFAENPNQSITDTPEKNEDPALSFKICDSDNSPIPGVKFTVCNDDTCEIVTTDENGQAFYYGEGSSFEVKVYSAPDGYLYDTGVYQAQRGEKFEAILYKEKENSTDISDNTDSGDDVIDGGHDIGVNPEPADEPEPNDSELSEALLQADRNPVYTMYFNTTDWEGNSYTSDIFEDYKLTIINGWEPWCGPCCSEMPDLERIHEDYKDLGVNVIGVNYDDGGMEDVLRSSGTTYPVLFENSDFDEMFNLGYVPSTILVDSGGFWLPLYDISASAYGYGNDDYCERVCIGAHSYSEWADILDYYLGR